MVRCLELATPPSPHSTLCYTALHLTIYVYPVCAPY